MTNPQFRPRVYVAGKYSAETDSERLANTERAMEVGIHLWHKGYAPFIPHLSHFTDALANRLGLPLVYKDWLAWDDCFQETCHVFFYDSMSTGADREHINARLMGQPIFRHLDDVPHARDFVATMKGFGAFPAPWLNGRSFPQEVLIKRLPHAEGLPLPEYQTQGAAAFDLCAAVPAGIPYQLSPGQTLSVPTGYCVAMPEGCAGLVLPRSSLAMKHSVSLANTTGLVDSDYRGELFMVLHNFGKTTFGFNRGSRLAQFVLISVNRAVLNLVTALPDSPRGEGAFGSTGVR